MQKSAVTAGKNLSYLKEFLAKSDMDSQDIENLILKAKSVLEHVSDHQKEPLNEQGLLLGFVQSGKTSALTTVTALAADNKIRLFIILTSDNTWLYSQTIERLQVSLPGIQIEGKDGWSSNFESIVDTLNSGEDSLILVSTKNATVLSKVVWMLDQLKSRTGNELPFTLIIDDEADQASLDTQTSKRAKNLDADPGKISDLIAQLRIRLPQHTYLQVTATPQALFLQDNGNLYRPEFTVLIEPGKGYTGGETYFSLIGGGKDRPI